MRPDEDYLTGDCRALQGHFMPITVVLLCHIAQRGRGLASGSRALAPWVLHKRLTLKHLSSLKIEAGIRGSGTQNLVSVWSPSARSCTLCPYLATLCARKVRIVANACNSDSGARQDGLTRRCEAQRRFKRSMRSSNQIGKRRANSARRCVP